MRAAAIEQRLAADRPVLSRVVQGRKGAPRETRVTALAALARPAPSLGLQLKADVLSVAFSACLWHSGRIASLRARHGAPYDRSGQSHAEKAQ